MTIQADVRELRPDDRDRVRVLHEASFPTELAFEGLVLDRLFTHPHAINLVAHADDEIVAFTSALHGTGPRARLLTIHVDPDHRNQGIATAMLDTLEERLGARKAKLLELEVHVDNEAARELYTSRGFEIHREDEAAYPTLDPSTGLVLRKQLA